MLWMLNVSALLGSKATVDGTYWPLGVVMGSPVIGLTARLKSYCWVCRLNDLVGNNWSSATIESFRLLYIYDASRSTLGR